MEMKSGIYDCLLASRHTTDIDGIEFIDLWKRSEESEGDQSYGV